MLQGACGYGAISKDSYPYWSVAALSLTNQFSVAGPAKACGECFEIKCVDIGGPFAVSACLPLPPAKPRAFTVHLPSGNSRLRQKKHLRLNPRSSQDVDRVWQRSWCESCR